MEEEKTSYQTCESTGVTQSSGQTLISELNRQIIFVQSMNYSFSSSEEEEELNTESDGIPSGTVTTMTNKIIELDEIITMPEC